MATNGIAPVFSLCHTSARPHKWREAYDEWLSKWSGIIDFEYILVGHHDWGFSNQIEALSELNYRDPTFHWEISAGPRDCITGWTKAFKRAQGQILIAAADDFFPPKDWDRLIVAAIGTRNPDTDAFVLRVNTDDESMTRDHFPTIISRKRYQDKGYALYPEYPSGMYADTDFCEQARHDGVVIDAPHLHFEHRHPYNNREKWPWDDVYAAQNADAGSIAGLPIITRRRQNGYKP